MTVDWYLYRRWLTARSTLGELFSAQPKDEGDRNFLSYILEDTYRGDDLSGDKLIPGRTCIPCGRYRLIWAYSPRFRRDTLRLVEVPFFAGILIHGGNTVDDTEGCLLTGLERSTDSVLNSQMALAPIETKARLLYGQGADLWLNVQLAPGVTAV